MHTMRSSEPEWLDFADAGIPGVKVQFAAPTRVAIRRASRAARAALAEFDLAGEVTDEMADASSEAYARSLIRSAIVAWEGVGAAPPGTPKEELAAKTVPVPVSKETVEVFLGDMDLFEAAELLYVLPILAREAEKNASAPSPNGTSAAATAARPTVRAAGPKPAKSAPTSSTNRKRTRAKTPGAS